jgi:hypothetical protein
MPGVVMDNCCECEPPEPPDWNLKNAQATKPWAAAFPFATYKCDTWGQSSAQPTLDEDGSTIIFTDLSMDGRDEAYAAMTYVDGHEQTVYLRETQVFNMVGAWGELVTESPPTYRLHYVSVPITLVAVWDKRDGQVVHQSVTLPEGGVPLQVGDQNIAWPDSYYVGHSSAAWTWNDDGSITHTGDEYWTWPSVGYDPERSAIPMPGRASFGAWWGEQGQRIYAWEITVARLSSSASHSIWAWTYVGEYTTFNVSSVYTLTEAYTIQAAIADAVTMLDTENLNTRSWWEQVNITWYRDMNFETNGAIALKYDVTTYDAGPWGAQRVYYFDGTYAQARKVRIQDLSTPPLVTDLGGTGQDIMEPSTVSTPYDGHAAVDGDSDVQENYFSGGLYDVGPEHVEIACGYTYGRCWGEA